MSGHSPATRLRAIRIGSWLAREAPTSPGRLIRYAAALGAIAVALSFAALEAYGARTARLHPADPRAIPYSRLAFPLEIGGSQYIPLTWADIAGWNDDDHLAAYQAFR